MKLVMLSDTHENHRQVSIPDGDVLIHAGDFTMMGEPKRIYDFADWFMSHPHKHKILVAGNHDVSLDRNHRYSEHGIIPPILEVAFEEIGITYLNEGAAVIDGVSFYGTPYTPSYGNWAFMEPEWMLKNRYNKIPYVDVLISHGPPKYILDTSRGESAGSKELFNRVLDMKPKIMVFGHIHDGYGHFFNGETHFYNAAICNGRYKVTNKPLEVEI